MRKKKAVFSLLLATIKSTVPLQKAPAFFSCSRSCPAGRPALQKPPPAFNRTAHLPRPTARLPGFSSAFFDKPAVLAYDIYHGYPVPHTGKPCGLPPPSATKHKPAVYTGGIIHLKYHICFSPTHNRPREGALEKLPPAGQSIFGKRVNTPYRFTEKLYEYPFCHTEPRVRER